MCAIFALANCENLISALDCFVEDLQEIRSLLKSKNEKAISRFFETAKKRRDEWVGKRLNLAGMNCRVS